MYIKYLGPSNNVNVEPYGPHLRDELKEYPDDFAEELLATSKRQMFEPVQLDPEDLTVAQLKKELEGKIEIPANAKKADLVELVRAMTENEGKE